MGSITHIERNPQKWKILRDDLRIKDTGEELLQVEIGDVDDYPDGCIKLIQFIRKFVYDKLISREYSIKRGPIQRLEIVDAAGNMVKPYLDDGSFIF